MKLKPFQEVGRAFLARNRYAILADEMRLGKTGQAIRAARSVQADCVLVVCPAVAVTMWRKARWDWAGEFSFQEFRVVSYDYARRHKEALTKTRFNDLWDVLILDEAHFLKSMEALRTRAILGRLGVARFADRVWALSGTPAPNHVGELWPLLKVFGVIQMTYEHFLVRYCRLDPFSGRVLGNKSANLGELKEIVSEVMMRRTKKQVAPELPEYTISSYPVRPDSSMLDLAWPVDHETRYGKMKALELKLKKELHRRSDEEKLTFLDNNVEELATLRRVTALLKVPALVELLQFELDSGLLEKCVVFGYHVEPLKVAREILRHRGYKVDMLYGGTPKRKKDAILTRFERKKGGTQVLFAQIIAAGVAIDLSAAHEGMLLEWDWVPGNNAQALERLGGYRQTMPVTFRDLRISGSFDDVITEVVKRKAASLNALYGDVGG